MGKITLIMNLSLIFGIGYLFIVDLSIERNKLESLPLFSFSDSYDIITFFLKGVFSWPLVFLYLFKIVVSSIIEAYIAYKKLRDGMIDTVVFGEFVASKKNEG